MEEPGFLFLFPFLSFDYSTPCHALTTLTVPSRENPKAAWVWDSGLGPRYAAISQRPALQGQALPFHQLGLLFLKERLELVQPCWVPQGVLHSYVDSLLHS